jgi:beta-xylosidase
MKKLIISCCLSLITTLCYANTCPSVQSLKSPSLTQWHIYDSDDNTPLTANRLVDFKKNVSQFILAEWVNNNHGGTIHCYYRDKDGSDLNAYVTNQQLASISSNHWWYKVTGATDCTASANKCRFSNKMEL